MKCEKCGCERFEIYGKSYGAVERDGDIPICNVTFEIETIFCTECLWLVYCKDRKAQWTESNNHLETLINKYCLTYNDILRRLNE